MILFMDFEPSDFECEDDRSDAQRARDAHAFLCHELLGTFEYSIGRRDVTPRALACRRDLAKKIRDIEGLADRAARAARAAAALLILFVKQARAAATSATATAAPADPQAHALGLSSITLTPRLLAQRPIAARVRAGLLLTT